MTMNNFDFLENLPGVIFKRFCTFGCTDEATGDLEIEIEGDTIRVPVCAECASSALDKVQQGMVD